MLFGINADKVGYVQMTTNTKKVLILIVAYNAEKTISSVLTRIPVAELPPATSVLVIDDASADDTVAEARRHGDNLGGIDLRVLYNPVNLGYGGNQKVGYEYAITHGYDVVVLLHGDGQYAPEKLPDLIKPILDDECDACFGSRIMQRGAALKNGMPLYKYMGNRILTWYQNFMLGMNLSEFHSGYRVYSVAALKKIPFKYNTSVFHFDTEIIIQLKLGGFRIKEIPIPTYYGDEICYVNGMKYAWDVFLTTLSSRLHQYGILNRRRYQLTLGNDVYDIKEGYTSSHTMAINAVRPKSKVLDVAGGPGYIAKKLREKDCHVTGIDQSDDCVVCYDRFMKIDLDNGELPGDLEKYDNILLLDCLEHFSRPDHLLTDIREKLFNPETKIIATAPNLAFFVTRFALLFGQFNYGAIGILDITHKRFFTFGTFTRLFKEEGYVVKRVKGIPPPMRKAFGNGIAGRFFQAVGDVLALVWPNMFAYQIYIEAEMTPPVSHLLEKTLATS